jgi:hypothetical protein
METRTKVAIVVVVLAAGGYLGWRWFAQDAAGRSDQELIAQYQLGAPGPTWPYNEEAHKRVQSGTLTLAELQRFAQSKDEHERAVAYRLMSLVPPPRTEAFKFIERQWGPNPAGEVRKQMIHTCLEFGKDGLHEVVKFLCTVAVQDPDGAIESEASAALKELTGLSLHKREEWRTWWGQQQGNYRIPADRLRKK